MVRRARRVLALLDLTRLERPETAEAIGALCARAERLPPAALCVYPEFVDAVRRELPTANIAAVANFPAGGEDADAVAAEIALSLTAGAVEIDLLVPWRALLAGRIETARTVIQRAMAACRGHARLKLILETGELKTEANIRRACTLGMACNVDFLKTSTGKTPSGASPAAARVMLEAIHAAGGPTGLKVSGGIGSLDTAQHYLDLTESIMGPDWITPDRFRIGASGLMDEIETVLGSGGQPG